MVAAVGLLFLLIEVSYGTKTLCDGRRDGAQCFESWGGTVFVQLMDNALETFRFEWIKGGRSILKWRENTIVTNTIKRRSKFMANNGTFRMSNLRNDDSGNYTLQLFDSQGKVTEKRTLQLYIEGESSLRLGAISALVFFSIHILAFVIIICIQMKKQKLKDEEIHADITYADVRVLQQQGTKSVKQHIEEEVEYSQIKTV